MDVSDVAEAEQESQNCASGTETTSNNIISYEYQIPEWFPKGNIKTPKDLDGLESRIHISNIDCDDQCLKHEDSSVYEIPYDLFSELSDITFAAFVRNADGNLPSELPGVLIRTSSTKYIEPIDGIVVQFAKDLGATLVSIDLEDLEDLGREFIRQDDNHSQPTQCEEDDAESPPEAPNLQSMTGLTEHYFVVKSEQHASKSAWLRVDRAISAIINAARVKNRACVSATPSDNETSQSSPIVLHLRNLNRILQIDYRYRFLARLRDFVQERRKAGESLIFLATMLTTVDPFYDEDYSTEPRIIAKMGISEGSSVTINPTPREGQEPSATERDSYVAMINTRRLKRLLRNRLLKGASISFLDPNSGWGNLDSSLDGSLWAESELKRAITHIAGRTYKKPALNLDDVEIVLRRLNLCKEPQPEITEVVQDDNVDETDGLTAWEEKIAGIRDDCNDFEKELLECVVNRENLESTYDDVIIDSESKETMKHLVSMSNSCPEAKSDFLLSQIRINGALLYGPPGTGKTHLSHAVAKESGMNMIAIDSASVISKYVGDSDKYIKAAFTLASKLFPCILFLDEVDCLFYRRSSDDKTWERSALTQFLQCLDGLVKDEKRPFVIAATNRPSDIDDAFLRRLPQKLLFELPDAVSRLKILRIFLKDEDLHSSLDVEGLANVTEGYSGSDLRNLCGEAAIIWTIEQGRGEAGDPPEEKAKLCLEARHFGKALRRIRPSVSKTALTEFANFTQQYNSNNLKYSY
ncbi:P-loop containing nucleoside triphosphate hydrolase protein [Annulohypoxylon bovei var. microspora]|nr:P-loop containing nucleoside triphosphate hydrolase protein [Annulohypoxylon bovei var. microspora]